MPCEHKEYCPIYAEKYDKSKIISKDYSKSLCDKVDMKTIKKGGFCPRADGIIHIQKVLYGAKD